MSGLTRLIKSKIQAKYDQGKARKNMCARGKENFTFIQNRDKYSFLVKKYHILKDETQNPRKRKLGDNNNTVHKRRQKGAQLRNKRPLSVDMGDILRQIK
jgi:hypothetical protein